MAAQPASAGTIHGFLRDRASREPIVMANVWIKDSAIGTTTNLKGYYVLPALPAGDYEICYRYVGYDMQVVRRTLHDGENLSLDIYLSVKPVEVEGAVVTADRDRRELDIKPSRIAVDAPQLRRIAQLAEPDLFRSLQMLPGVATLSDFAAGLYIRGGSPDQNLILLDQIDVYNPNHMFGFFSTFNTDAIKSVELLKGGFPAEYGGRLSSVLNVINKEGNRDRMQGVARLSLLSSSATVEGPWHRGSWMISGRRTYLDLASKLIDFNLPYYFYDGHARFNWDLDPRNLLSLSLYTGDDKLDYDNDGSTIGLDWGNRTFSAQWTHLFHSQLFAHFIFAGSRFRSDTRVRFDDIAFGILNQIDDLSLKGLLTWTPSLRHSMDFGFEVKDLDFQLDYQVVEPVYRNRFAGRYFALFYQDNMRLNPWQVLQAGLRFDGYSDGGYMRLAPRLALRHQFTDRWSATLSYGLFYQYLNLVQQEGISFADMWFPVDETFSPARADHYIAGFTYDDQRAFSLQVEAYYKQYDHIAEYRTYRGGDEELSNMTAAQNFLPGRGRAWGLDLFLRNNVGRCEGWIGYSLAWTRKRVIGFNFDRTYYPTYDRRHTVTLMEDLRLSRKWRLNFAFKYGSGQPFTGATARYLEVDPAGHAHFEALEGSRNTYRLPDYHRLDLGLFYTTLIWGRQAEFFLQAVNVYDHDNVWFREFQMDKNPVRIKDYTQLPLLPTGGFSIYF